MFFEKRSSVMTTTIDDFVMLGTTVPEPAHSGRIFVCSAGVSRDLQSLIRIYPLARAHVPNRWGRYTVTLERNPQDSRHESWRIAGDRSAPFHERINDRFTLTGNVSDHARPELLRPFVADSIKYANRLQGSLAIINPHEAAVHFTRAVEDDPDSPQLALFDEPEARPSKATARFPWKPYVAFRDRHGPHDLQIRDWGTYELMRKRGEDYAREHLAGALHLREDSSLLCGNQANRRTAWLVISVLNGIRVQPGLFDRLPSERPFIPAAVRQRVMERDQGTCQNCGAPAEAIDHIWPTIRGGQSTDDNLQALCRDCNLAKSDVVP
jgi:hypothetical protein